MSTEEPDMTRHNDMTVLDFVMASFITEIGESCSQTAPQVFQKRAAFDQARIEGLIRHVTTLAHGGRSIEVYSLTDKGRPVAYAAKARMLRSQSLRSFPSTDLWDSHHAAMGAAA